ncbi:MAG: hypothetical protein LBE65_00085, partial [Synergistaceae bacterium]|nr:hypothetical protein [Synergistaceae bacterium]
NISYFPLIVYIREKNFEIRPAFFAKNFFDSQISQPLRFNFLVPVPRSLFRILSFITRRLSRLADFSL